MFQYALWVCARVCRSSHSFVTSFLHYNAWFWTGTIGMRDEYVCVFVHVLSNLNARVR